MHVFVRQLTVLLALKQAAGVPLQFVIVEQATPVGQHVAGMVPTAGQDKGYAEFGLQTHVPLAQS